MVTKRKAGQKKGRVKVGNLKLNKETVKNLSAGEQRKVKGGLVVASGVCVETGETCRCVRPRDPNPSLLCR